MLAAQVATQLMAHDALGAHARDELGISEAASARPVQAALASAATFAVGAATAAGGRRPGARQPFRIWRWPGHRWCSSRCWVPLAARAGGAAVIGAPRVTFWGALAMGINAGVGALFGVAV